MMKAIVTKYIGPTNTRGSRISVKAEGLPKMIVGWDDALHVNANHTRAACRYAAKYEWRGQWTGGGMPDQTGNCYVRVPQYTIDAPALVADEDSFYIPMV